MPPPPDAPLVLALATHHAWNVQRSYPTFKPEWRGELVQRLCWAIDQAIQTEVEAVERELP